MGSPSWPSACGSSSGVFHDGGSTGRRELHSANFGKFRNEFTASTWMVAGEWNHPYALIGCEWTVIVTLSHADRAGGRSGGVEADGVGDVGQVAGVAGDDAGLMAHGSGDDERVHDIGAARGGARYPGGRAEVLVVGEDVAAFEDTGDLVLRPAAPGLRQGQDRDDWADARGGELVMQGRGVRVAAFSGQERAGVIGDGGHLPGGAAAALIVSSTSGGTEIESFRAVMQ